MATGSTISERINCLQKTDASPPGSPSDLASNSSSSSSVAKTPDCSELFNSSSAPSSRDAEAQSVLSLRNEEYRRLFRLPADEVIVQDFNCAYQENILLQGHMYIFVHYICFYSNIFGFETKKIIPFQEITSVNRAKSAGIFPTAIEIIAGEKKYFFASFLSRDEAFKTINDGWFQHGTGSRTAVAEVQESVSGSINQDNGTAQIEKASSLKNVNDLESNDRRQNDPCPSDSSPSSCNEDDAVPITTQLQDGGVQVHVDKVVALAEDIGSSSSNGPCMWTEENCDAPDISALYTKVAETKFGIKVEDFFSIFFSDNSTSFTESFHSRCGDKDFRCTSWKSDEKFGHVRNLSFLHPIKIYFGTRFFLFKYEILFVWSTLVSFLSYFVLLSSFYLLLKGARFGSCQEIQKFQVYRNGHLVIETSQEINDVPYGDYFRVEGLWDVVKDIDGSNEGCILKVYVGVAFSKKTVFKGKIVQSTLEECREAYGIWINMAHEYLKQNPEQEGRPAGSSANPEVLSEIELKNGEASERSSPLFSGHSSPQRVDSSVEHVDSLVHRNTTNGPPTSSLVGGCRTRLYTFFKRQSQVSMILLVAFVLIFLMQVSIVVLLNRPQPQHAIPGDRFVGNFGREWGSEGLSEEAEWLERRMQHLKDEMLMVEARLERLRKEHGWLKQQIKDFDTRVSMRK
ncbi:Protein VASCULAR ASSOCIATED DEATH 1, chloroplastic [Linum perenne]